MTTDLSSDPALPSLPVTGGLFRVDSAAVLKRFFHLERALTVACAAWIPAARRLETKSALSKATWEDALTAGALRDRVFELKYPDRGLELGPDGPLVRLYEAARHAPGTTAFLRCLTAVLLPALQSAYEIYLEDSDAVADGPTHRFLGQALRDHAEQIEALGAAAAAEADAGDDERTGDDWSRAMAGLLAGLSAGGSEPPEVVAPGRPWQLAETPGRDERYFANPFYWPDNFDPGYPYGSGLRLQLRSAVSHLNEVWAVDTAAANLVNLSGELGSEFTFDAARWLYDESRHMNMGRLRLERWGLTPAEVPLGGYIYDACRGQEPLLRLAMLAYFETKNIGKKRDRAEEFHALGDEASARDMDFDWADEGIHASYGRRWMKAALERRGRSPEEWHELLARCETLVAERVAAGTPEERAALVNRAQALIERAEVLAAQRRG
jgi:hypothetical protein